MMPAFPTKQAIWYRAILGGIVNAVKTAESESFGCFEGWIRNHYVLNGVDGRDGVITFAGGHWYADAPLVGVFHDVHSERFSSSHESDIQQFFLGCPTYQRSLAEQAALTFLEIEYNGKLLHRVTAAFWDEGELLTAADPWTVLVENGASLIAGELTDDIGLSLARFAESYGMTAEQSTFSRLLFERKLARPPATIKLSIDDVAFLESTFKDPRIEYAELDSLKNQRESEFETKEQGFGAQPKWWEAIDPKTEFEKAMSTCREKFAELGIVFP